MQMFGKAIGDAPLQAYISALLFSPAESITHKQFYSEAPRWIQTWPNDVTNWTSCTQKLEGMSGGRYGSLTISACGTWLAACIEYHQEITIWDIESGRSLCSNQPEEGLREIKSKWFEFSPRNDNELAVLSSDETLLIFWDITTHEPIRQIELPGLFGIWDLDFLPSTPDTVGISMGDGRRNYSVAYLNTQRQEEPLIKSFNLPHLPGRSYANKIAFSSANSDILGFAFQENAMIVYNIGTDTVIRALPLGMVISIASSPNGKYMAVLSKNRPSITSEATVSCTLLDCVTGAVLFNFTVSTSVYGSLNFSPDGRLLGVGIDGNVQIWDMASHQCVQKIGKISGSFCFSPMENSKLFCGSYGSIDVIEIGPHEIMSPPNKPISPTPVKISPDGRLVVCQDFNVLEIWDTDSGEHLFDIRAKNNDMYRSIQFSHDSSKLTLGSDSFLEVWDVSSHKARQVYSKHKHSSFELVKKMTFSPNCQYLAIEETLLWGFGDAASIMILDMNSENRSVRFKTATVLPIIDAFIAFSPDSKQLAACLTLGCIGAHLTGIEVWDIASASTARILIFSETYFRDHLSRRLQHLCTSNCVCNLKYPCFNPSKMSFTDNNHLSLVSEKGSEERLNPSCKIKVILTIEQNTKSEPETLDRNLHAREESINVVHLLDSWVTVNGERVVWLPPEYRPSNYESSWDARSNCIAISSPLRPLSIMKFDCSVWPRQVALRGGEKRQHTSSASQRHKRSRTSDLDENEDFLVLRFDMGLPNGKEVGRYHKGLELDGEDPLVGDLSNFIQPISNAFRR